MSGLGEFAQMWSFVCVREFRHAMEIDALKREHSAVVTARDKRIEDLTQASVEVERSNQQRPASVVEELHGNLDIFTHEAKISTWIARAARQDAKLGTMEAKHARQDVKLATLQAEISRQQAKIAALEVLDSRECRASSNESQTFVS